MSLNDEMVTKVGLPLLIVNGKFKNLASMTVEDLETFIPFLVKCSVSRAGAQVINGVPEWWSSTIQYKFPLKKPIGLSDVGYLRHLSAVVCRCYWYHNAQYLLPFCAKIASRPDSIYMRNNEDNTTSIFLINTTVGVMKFSNENKNYDQHVRKKEKIFKRCLLPILQKKAPVMDIYLCENCDAEFSSHTEMQNHEKECERNTGDNDNFSDSSEEVEILEHIKSGDSSSSSSSEPGFFNYLQLRPKNSSDSTRVSNSKRNLTESFPKRRIKYDSYFNRHKNVEFSSLFGRHIIKNCPKPVKKSTQNTVNGMVESYCGQNIRTVREGKESLDFKVTCSRKVNRKSWVHQYCFNKTERRRRYKTLKTGLDENSRKLLRQCKKLRIVLPRLELNSRT